jgi:hypothetical protein
MTVCAGWVIDPGANTWPSDSESLRVRHGPAMKLSNDCYLILLGMENFTERYYRDEKGWLKASARGRTFRMTAEWVLNHVLPALAGIRPNPTVRVEYRDASAPRS